MGYTAAVAGASGYAGGELLRLLLAHPEIEIGALTAGGNAGSPARRAPAAPGPARRPGPRRDHPRDPGRARRRLPRPAARPVRRRSRRSSATTPSSSTAAPTSGSTDAAAWEKFYGVDARRHLALRPARTARGQREALRGARRIAVPGCYPTPSTLALFPPSPPVWSSPRSSWSPPPAPPAPASRQAAPARQRGHGLGRAPTASAAATGTPPRSSRTSPPPRATGRRLLHPDPGADAPRHPRHLHRPRRARRRPPTTSAPPTRGLDDETVRAPAARGAVARHRDDPRRQHRRSSRSPGRARRPHRRRSPPSTTSPRGPRAGRCRAPNLALGLPEDHRPHHRLESRRERHRALGFRAAGVAAGIKAAGKPDLALVVNDGPSSAAAAVFTSNRVGRPGALVPQVVKDGRVDAVILNSGGANACTGPQGFQDTHTTAEKTRRGARRLRRRVVVCSTGLIGERLPMDETPGRGRRRRRGARRATAARGGHAIRTTDTVSKTAFTARRRTADTIGGMAKGAGMLAPVLATMLVVLTTDADVPPDVLDAVLRDATRRHLRPGRLRRLHVHQRHRGAAGLRRLRRRARPRPSSRAGLTEVCAELARRLIGDAEGASNDIAIEVVSAASERGRGKSSAAPSPAPTSSRCAIFGKDPNWGRVLSAVGTTDAAFEPDQLNVAINGVWMCRNGSIGDDRATRGPRPARGHRRHRPAGRRRRGHDLHQRPHRDYVHENARTPMTRENPPADALDKAATLIEALPWLQRFHGSTVVDQVRRQRHGRRRAAARLRRGRRVPAPRRPPPRRGARRRPADQRQLEPARHRIRIQGRAAGHHARGHGRGPDGPRRPGGTASSSA